LSVVLRNEAGEKAVRLVSGKPFWVEVEIEIRESIIDLNVGILIRSPKGIDLFGTENASSQMKVDGSEPRRIKVRLNGLMHLAQGEYFLTVGLAHQNKEKIDLWYDAAHFRVVGTEQLYTTSLVNLGPCWTIEHL
jgi:hypothetical protein